MSQRPADTVIVLREKPRRWLSGTSLILVGAAVVWSAIRLDAPPDGSSRWLGVAFGLLFVILGWAWLRKEENVLLDPRSRLVWEITSGWLGRAQRRKTPFSEIASVGINALKDPRNDRVWSSEPVLRLQNGTRISIGREVPPGEIGRLAGFAVEDTVVEMVQPLIHSS